jgi:hypothetical protein
MKKMLVIALSLSIASGCFFFWANPITGQGSTKPALDLTKIERKILKEPVYNTSPKYCLVTFGKDAKLKVWVVIDGDMVYVDLNGNSDLTEKREWFKLKDRKSNLPLTCVVGDVYDPHTKLTHKDFTIGVWGDDFRLDIDAAFENSKVPRLHGTAWWPTFGDKPADAPIVNFGGQLTMELGFATQNDRPALLRAEIGTPGLGKKAFANYTKSVMDHLGYMDSVLNHRGTKLLMPHAELVYSDSQKNRICEKTAFYLDLMNGYYYPIEPGQPADKRQVQITLSFPGWEDGKVAPRSFTVPIVTLKNEK